MSNKIEDKNYGNCGNVDECVSLLLEELKRGGLSIFCGAGISYDSGIMTAEPLIKYLLGYLSADQEDIDRYLKDDNGIFRLPIPFEAIIESINSNLRFENTAITFIEPFSHLFDGTPNVYHKLFAHLLLSGKIRFIVTTNFDTCMEQALKWNKEDARVIVPYTESLDDLISVDIIGKVVKLHGCKNIPESLGVTVDQITRTEHWKKTSIMLDKIFYEGNCNVVLFIGYSCSDMWDIAEYFKNCNLQNKKLVSCIYWQHSIEQTVTISTNSWKMLGRQSSLFFGGDSSILISKLCAGEKLILEKKNLNYDHSMLESYIPVDPNYVLGKLFQESHYYDLAIKSYEKTLYRLGENISEIRIETLKELSIIYEKNNDLAKAEALINKAIELTYKLDINGSHNQFVGVLNQYADLLCEIGKLDKAKDLYLLNIAVVRKMNKGIHTKDDSSLGHLYNMLSHVYHTLHDYQNTQKYYQLALDIFRECAKESPQKFLPDIAMVLCNWAIVANELNDFVKAGEFYKEALGIYRKLAEVNVIYLSDVATTLNNLGVFQYDRKDYDLANKSLDEALQIRKDLSKYSAAIYLPYVATTLLNSASNYMDQNDYNIACKLCEEAVDIFRKLSHNDYGLYSDQLAHSLTNMANILYRDNKINEALLFCEEAIFIREELAKSCGQVATPDLVIDYMCLATIQQCNNADMEAKKTYEKLLVLSTRLIKMNRSRHIKNHAMILFNYANYMFRVKTYKRSKQLYSKALKIFKELSTGSPCAFLPNVIDIIKRICYVNVELNCAIKNNELWNKIFEYNKELAKHNPQIYLPKAAIDLIEFADTQYEFGSIVTALEKYKSALEILRGYEFMTSKFAQIVIDTLNKLGCIYFELSQYVKATGLYQNAIQYNEKCIEAGDKYFTNIAMTLTNMGNSQYANGEIISAKESYENAIKSYQMSNMKESEDYLYGLSIAQYNICELYSRRYENNEKIVLYMKNCIEMRRRLVEIDEDKYFSSLTKALDLLGVVYYKYGHNHEAEMCLSEILDRCEKLSVKKPQEYLYELAKYQIAIARFYKYNVIDKNKSMSLAMKAVDNLNQYSFCDQINDDLEEAKAVLDYWCK